MRDITNEIASEVTTITALRDKWAKVLLTSDDRDLASYASLCIDAYNKQLRRLGEYDLHCGEARNEQ